MSKNELNIEKKKCRFPFFKKGLKFAALGLSLISGVFLFSGCIKGDRGEPGKSGSIWLTGQESPSNTYGNNDDLYLNTNTNDIYIKMDGEWVFIGNLQGDKGEKGDTGAKGKDGIDGLTPTLRITADGYWEINGLTTSVKAAGVEGNVPTISINANGYWTIDGNSTGVKAKGEDGAEWFVGDIVDGLNIVEAIVPGSTIGDLYLNTLNGNIYKCIGTNSWLYAGNLKGADAIVPNIGINEDGFWTIDGVSTGVKAEGKDGTNGQNGADGSTWFYGTIIDGTSTQSANIADSKVGDFYFNVTNCNIYACTSQNNWTYITNIKGSSGRDGAQWIIGTLISSTDSGISMTISNSKVGDLYFNTDNNYLYQCVAENTWNYIACLKGSDGADGADGADGSDGANGADGSNGSNGINGKDGTVWLYGDAIHGYAASQIVVISGSKLGDLYFNTTTNNLYQCIAENTWKYLTCLKGDEGSIWHYGTELTGTNDQTKAIANTKFGDFYLNVSTCNVYSCTGSDTWRYVSCLKGEEGVSIVGTSAEYKDINGTNTLVFTITYSDGRVEEVVTKTSYIHRLEQSTFIKTTNPPQLKLLISNDAGDIESIYVTDDMIVRDNINFSTPGHYSITISYNGQQAEFEIIVASTYYFKLYTPYGYETDDSHTTHPVFYIPKNHVYENFPFLFLDKCYTGSSEVVERIKITNSMISSGQTLDELCTPGHHDITIKYAGINRISTTICIVDVDYDNLGAPIKDTVYSELLGTVSYYNCGFVKILDTNETIPLTFDSTLNCPTFYANTKFGYSKFMITKTPHVFYTNIYHITSITLDQVYGHEVETTKYTYTVTNSNGSISSYAIYCPTNMETTVIDGRASYTYATIHINNINTNLVKEHASALVAINISGDELQLLNSDGSVCEKFSIRNDNTLILK